ncbi:hypothetical protein [Rhizobium sp. 21-4511-3d]
MTAADRLAASERTNSAAREALAEERRRREEKTERLRKARLQAQEQGRQL